MYLSLWTFCFIRRRQLQVSLFVLTPDDSLIISDGKFFFSLSLSGIKKHTHKWFTWLSTSSMADASEKINPMAVAQEELLQLRLEYAWLLACVDPIKLKLALFLSSAWYTSPSPATLVFTIGCLQKFLVTRYRYHSWLFVWKEKVKRYAAHHRV